VVVPTSFIPVAEDFSNISKATKLEEVIFKII
jgi:hypothetical protein